MVVLSGMIPEVIQEDSDTKELSITFSPPRQPVVMFPQPKPKPPPTWTERHRKHIEGCKEPLAEPFANVSKVVWCSLEDARNSQGGLEAKLWSVTKVTHGQSIKKYSRVLEETDKDEGSGKERHDANGGEKSQDLHELNQPSNWPQDDKIGPLAN